MSAAMPTVWVGGFDTSKMGSAKGKIYGDAIIKHLGQALRKKGFRIVADREAADYGIFGVVSDYSYVDKKVTIEQSCNAEKKQKLQHRWRMTPIRGSVPGVVSERDMKGALDDLAFAFAPKIAAAYAPHLKSTK